MAVTPVYIKVKRPGHTERWHVGATQNGVVLTPEACNLDDAHREVQTAPPPVDTPVARLCKRCFVDRHRPAQEAP